MRREISYGEKESTTEKTVRRVTRYREEQGTARRNVQREAKYGGKHSTARNKVRRKRRYGEKQSTFVLFMTAKLLSELFIVSKLTISAPSLAIGHFLLLFKSSVYVLYFK